MRNLQKKEIRKTYIFTAFGFPLLLHNVEILEDGEYEYPNVNLAKTRRKAMKVLEEVLKVHM